jgi:hypothetical protein
MRSANLLPVILALASAGDAAAQRPAVEPGQRVRITAPLVGLQEVTATVFSVGGGALVVTGDSTVRVRLEDVTRLEVSRGRKSNCASGLGWGFLAGATTGVVIGLASGSERQGSLFGGGCWMLCSAGAKAMVAGAALGTAGAVVGLVVGAIVRSEKWKRVPLDGVRVSIVPRRGGLGLGASVAF